MLGDPLGVERDLALVLLLLHVLAPLLLGPLSLNGILGEPRACGARRRSSRHGGRRVRLLTTRSGRETKHDSPNQINDHSTGHVCPNHHGPAAPTAREKK